MVQLMAQNAREFNEMQKRLKKYEAAPKKPDLRINTQKTEEVKNCMDPFRALFSPTTQNIPQSARAAQYDQFFNFDLKPKNSNDWTKVSKPKPTIPKFCMEKIPSKINDEM